MIARKNEVAFLEWVKKNCEASEDSIFFELLRKKLSGYNDNFLEFFINNVHNQIFTNTIITSYHNSNQVKWNIYSLIIINDLAINLRDGKKNLMDIIKKLGKERHYIAMDLEHGQAYYRNEYGAIRGEETSITEICYECIKEQDTPFSYLYHPIDKEIDKLVNANFFKNIPEEKIFEDAMACEILLADDWNNKTKIALVNELPNQSDDMCILVKKDKGNGKNEVIGITYPTVEVNNVQSRVYALQTLFDKILMINLKNNDNLQGNLKNFLIALGELSYHLYRLLPVRRGTSAIVDWIVRALAESKNIQLGTRKKNELPPDFHAFLAANITEYSNWFAQNAFDNPQFLYQNEGEKIEPVNSVGSEVRTSNFFSSNLSAFFYQVAPNILGKLGFSDQYKMVEDEKLPENAFGFFSQNAAHQFITKLDSELPNLIKRENILNDIHHILLSYEVNVEVKQKSAEYSSYDTVTRNNVIKKFQEQVSPLVKAEISKLKNVSLEDLQALHKVIINNFRQGLNPYEDCAKLYSQNEMKINK